MYFQLAVSGLLTESIEFSLLPTPRTVDVEGGAVSNVQNDGKGWYRENAKGERWGVKLRDVVKGMLPGDGFKTRRTKHARTAGNGRTN